MGAGVQVDEAKSLERLVSFLGGNARDYERTHTRLCSFFRWKGCANAEDLADTTLERVKEKIEAGTEVQAAPKSFVLGVARFVYLESVRRETRKRAALAELPAADAQGREHEERMTALGLCLETLGDPDRGRLLRYHAGQGQGRIAVRKQMAQSEGIPQARLRIQMHRLRLAIERCVRGRLAVN